MTDEQIEFFRMGYWECRTVVLVALRKACTKKRGRGAALEKLLAELDADEKRDVWASVQAEFPGITREQYEAELEASAQAIRETFYSPAGFLRPRLVRDLVVGDIENQ